MVAGAFFMLDNLFVARYKGVCAEEQTRFACGKSSGLFRNALVQPFVHTLALIAQLIYLT